MYIVAIATTLVKILFFSIFHSLLVTGQRQRVQSRILFSGHVFVVSVLKLLIFALLVLGMT